MLSQTVTTQKCYLASLALVGAYTDFITSVFLNWVEEQYVTNPEQIDARLVRHYLATLATKGKSDKTLHAHARAIRTLLRSWYAEKYVPEPVTFAMRKWKRSVCLFYPQAN